MTMTLQQAEWAESWAEHLSGLHLPYRYYGGYGVGPLDGRELPPTNPPQKVSPLEPSEPGYACSSAVSAVLWRAGVLGHQEALDTEELETYGEPGVGQYVSVRVLDTPAIHHCFLMFTLPGRPVRLWAAQVPGTTVGWFTASPDWVAAFNARHP